MAVPVLRGGMRRRFDPSSSPSAIQQVHPILQVEIAREDSAILLRFFHPETPRARSIIPCMGPENGFFSTSFVPRPTVQYRNSAGNGSI